MRLFLIISITLITLSSNAQNCKKIILEPHIAALTFESSLPGASKDLKDFFYDYLVKPNFYFKKYILYLKENKGVYTSNMKKENYDEVSKMDVLKISKNHFYISHSNDTSKQTVFFIDLIKKKAILADKCLYDVTISQCEF